MGVDPQERVRGLIQGALAEHSERLRGHRVVLFGSRARSNARARSDFDLGVIGDSAMPLRDFYAVEDALEALPTLFKIDWVDLNRASERFRVNALSHAEILYE